MSGGGSSCHGLPMDGRGGGRQRPTMCGGVVPSLRASLSRSPAPCLFMRGVPSWILGSPVRMGWTSASRRPSSPCSCFNIASFSEQCILIFLKLTVLYMPSWRGTCLRSLGGQGMALRLPLSHCRISLSGLRGRCSVIVCNGIMGELLVVVLGSELVSQSPSWKVGCSGRGIGSTGLRDTCAAPPYGM